MIRCTHAPAVDVKIPPSGQKLRGGYYTPAVIAEFLARWAIRSGDDTVLEPSAGDGAFLVAAAKQLRLRGGQFASITGVEIDPDAASASRAAVSDSPGANVHTGDFFEWAARSVIEGRRFDAILGNPPFLRFAYFEEKHRDIAFDLMRREGMRPTRLTNAWVPFLVASSALLEPNGRLAMVVPAELLQVSYAAELRQYLADRFERVTLFAFDRLVFEGIQQEVVLLTAERTAPAPRGIRVVELSDASELSDGYHAWEAVPVRPLDHSSEKWTRYFLEPEELELVRALAGHRLLQPLGSFAEVDVGVVTGMNDFFVMDANGTTHPDLKAQSVPVITRSNQLVGASVTPEDWQEQVEAGKARVLLALNEGMDPSGVVADYIAMGERRKVHLGYKCSIRRKWWVVPSIWRPSGFMLRQIHVHPKLVMNTTPATSTDTVHRVAFNYPRPEAVVASFHNVMTFLFAEIMGRSYGGGVLELEPSEAESLPIVHPDSAPEFHEVDAALRSGDPSQALDVGAPALASLGLSPSDEATLRVAWERLRGRRSRRGRTRGAKQLRGPSTVVGVADRP